MILFSNSKLRGFSIFRCSSPNESVRFRTHFLAQNDVIVYQRVDYKYWHYLRTLNAKREKLCGHSPTHIMKKYNNVFISDIQE